MFNENKQVLQNYAYYPFGMTMGGFDYNSSATLKNDYLYNGKELQDDFGLGWYDYGARFYDAVVGRFHTKDRYAEKFFDYTPYQYAGDNPISNIDFKGDSIIKVTINDKSGYIKGQSTLYIDHTIFNDTKTFLEYAASNKIPIHINSSFRTNKKQGELTSTNSTTPAKKSKSPHNAGLAIDFNLYKNDKVSDGIDKGNSTVTKDHKLIKKVTSMSWRWGGNWKKPDKIHIDKRGTDSNFTTIRDANQKQMDGDNKKEVDETLIKRTETITINKNKKE
jgi:RHS repeat-associated protein